MFVFVVCVRGSLTRRFGSGVSIARDRGLLGTGRLALLKILPFSVLPPMHLMSIAFLSLSSADHSFPFLQPDWETIIGLACRWLAGSGRSGVFGAWPSLDIQRFPITFCSLVLYRCNCLLCAQIAVMHSWLPKKNVEWDVKPSYSSSHT